jgi:chromosome segregation ATPase
LFNSKKKKAAAEAEQAQRVQSAALQAQLDEVRSQRAALEERIVTLDQANAQLDSRLAALDQGVGSISEELVRLTSASAATSQRLRSIDDRVTAADVRVDAISHRLGDVESLSSDLDEINRRLAAFESTTEATSPPPPSTPTPPPPAPPVSPEPPPPPPAIAEPPPPPAPSAPDDDLNERIAELRAQLDALAEHTTSIDARVTGVSLELANQLTELGRDIDELNRRSTEPATGDGAAEIETAELEARINHRLDTAIDDVLDSTERLAAEQARYEIQFRADLAELAERLRRPTT